CTSMRLSGNAGFIGIVALALSAGLLLGLAGGANASPVPGGSGATVYSVPAATAASTERQEQQLGPVFSTAPAMSLFSAGARSGAPRGIPSPVSFPGV